MAQSNLERVGRALEILNVELQPFIEREMRAAHGKRWMQVAASSLRDYQMPNARSGEPTWDT
jgi:ribonuclease-3